MVKPARVFLRLGVTLKWNADKNFTVRFTVKTFRLGAMDADRRPKVIY
jgi:hypothetical protein